MGQTQLRHAVPLGLVADQFAQIISQVVRPISRDITRRRQTAPCQVAAGCFLVARSQPAKRLAAAEEARHSVAGAVHVPVEEAHAPAFFGRSLPGQGLARLLCRVRPNPNWAVAGRGTSVTKCLPVPNVGCACAPCRACRSVRAACAGRSRGAPPKTQRSETGGHPRPCARNYLLCPANAGTGRPRPGR